MSFTILIPARMASTRLPNKPLLDIGGLPMIVRVAQQALRTHAQRVVVATDAPAIREACTSHNIEVVMTRHDHPSGSDRLAEACSLLDLPQESIVVNVQGDEPLIDPALINAVALLLQRRTDCAMSTAAHVMTDDTHWVNPNIVKVVVDANNTALYFSRSLIPFDRNGMRTTMKSTSNLPLRHVGLYGYRVHFLKRFPKLSQAPIENLEALEQLRVLWHGERIAVHITSSAVGIGVDTPEDLASVRQAWSSHAMLNEKKDSST